MAKSSLNAYALLLMAFVCFTRESHSKAVKLHRSKLSVVYGDDSLSANIDHAYGANVDYGGSNSNDYGWVDENSSNNKVESSDGSEGSATLDGGNPCEIVSSGVNSNDIATILKDHNQLRSKVANGRVNGQPTAADMNQLLWDDSLGRLAQEWANQCKFAHNKPVDKKYEYIGQNLEETDNNRAAKNFTKAIYNWFYEYEDPGYSVKYPSDDGGYPFVFSEGTGHYTQMIWATITHVGCGYVDFKRAGYAHNHLYVCNYGPSGNVRGEDIYIIGKPASKCASKRPSSTIRGLCDV